MMKKRLSISACVMITLFCMIVTFQVTFVYCTQRYAGENVDTDVLYDRDKLAYVDSIYRNYFVEQIDPETLTDTMIDGYLYGAGERFGSYLTAEERESYIDSLEGDGVGIGVTVQYDGTTGFIEIVSVFADSPAQSAGLQAGDVLVDVDGSAVADLGYYGTVAAVRGEEGTELSLTVNREGEPITVTMTRAAYTEQTVYARMYEDTPIGVILITGFNTATVEQFRDALSTLQADGVQALIFDLRGNPGGELNSITSILDLLLPEGDIIIATDKDGTREVLATSDAAELDLPMAVLTDGGTASAAELFAGNIRDYEKGVLIGETTFGKGTMQTLVDLPDGSAVSITYRKFASASGESHDGVGIAPDIEAALPEEVANLHPYKITDAQDTVLAEAIKYLNNELSN